MDEFHLRPATAEDERLIRATIRAMRLNPLGLDWRRFTIAETQAGRFAGCVQVKPHRDGSRELASLAVSPAFRGRGVARLLINHLFASEAPPLYLTCRAELHDFYQKFGFCSLTDASDMPPYFRRLSRLAGAFLFLARRTDRMLVMVWRGA
jgi:N-acetylglutamate synthase-like GNAT family acetyltransferase